MVHSARATGYIVSGLPTTSRATTRRRPLTPRTTTQVRLCKQLLDKRTGALLVLPLTTRTPPQRSRPISSLEVLSMGRGRRRLCQCSRRLFWSMAWGNRSIALLPLMSYITLIIHIVSPVYFTAKERGHPMQDQPQQPQQEQPPHQFTQYPPQQQSYPPQYRPPMPQPPPPPKKPRKRVWVGIAIAFCLLVLLVLLLAFSLWAPPHRQALIHQVRPHNLL